MSARVAADDSRKLTLPADPNAYKLGPSQNFKPPAGVEFKIDEANPSWSMARQWAHKNGITQEAFHEMTDLFAGYQVGEQQQIATAKAAEVAKLGAAGGARVDAVKTWLTAMGGEHAKALVGVLDYAPVAGTVIALEALMSRFTSQGGSPGNPGAARDAGNGGRISQADYDKLTYSEKKDYAAKHAAH